VLVAMGGPEPNFLSLYVLLPLLIMGPPTFMMGATFPFLQRAVQKITPSPDMSRPRQDETSEAHIGPGLEARQSVLFDQVMAEPAESKSGMVVAEARSGDHAKPNVGEARAVTVAALEAEIDRPTDDQGKQVRIRLQARRSELGQNIQRREG